MSSCGGVGTTTTTATVTTSDGSVKAREFACCYEFDSIGGPSGALACVLVYLAAWLPDCLTARLLDCSTLSLDWMGGVECAPPMDHPCVLRLWSLQRATPTPTTEFIRFCKYSAHIPCGF